MTKMMILDIIRNYQYVLECIMDNTPNQKEYIRSNIKHDAAEELKGIIIRRFAEIGDDVIND